MRLGVLVALALSTCEGGAAPKARPPLYPPSVLPGLCPPAIEASSASPAPSMPPNAAKEQKP